MGRPTKYRKEYCEKVQEWGREGRSFSEMAAELGISRQTWYDWQDRHPEFLEAVNLARDLSQAWWEKQARLGLFETRDKKFNDRLWALNMRHRFPDDWREQPQEINVTRTIKDMSDEELLAEAARIARQLSPGSDADE